MHAPASVAFDDDWMTIWITGDLGDGPSCQGRPLYLSDMVDLRAPLTPRQLEILRWVAAGCPDGVMEGHGHKILATALDSRGMITISKKDGDWRASLTDRGRYYLDHDAYPPAEPASAEPAQRSTTSRAIEQLDSASIVGEELIAKLVAAGGVITIDTRADPTNYREQIDAARRWKKIPPGQQLIYEGAEGTAWHVYELRLEAVPAWWTAELVPIPVPDQMRGPTRSSPPCGTATPFEASRVGPAFLRMTGAAGQGHRERRTRRLPGGPVGDLPV